MKKPTHPPIKLFWVKVGVLIVTDILCLFGIFHLGSGLDAQATEAQKLMSQKIQNSTQNQSQILESELEKYATQIETLQKYFPNESSIVDFISAINNLKNAGIISNFSFVSDAVKDKQGFVGIPVTVDVVGDINVVNSGFSAVVQLPYLIKPVVLSINQSADGVVTAKLGGFVYVDKNFGQTR